MLAVLEDKQENTTGSNLVRFALLLSYIIIIKKYYFKKVPEQSDRSIMCIVMIAINMTDVHM